MNVYAWFRLSVLLLTADSAVHELTSPAVVASGYHGSAGEKQFSSQQK